MKHVIEDYKEKMVALGYMWNVSLLYCSSHHEDIFKYSFYKENDSILVINVRRNGEYAIYVLDKNYEDEVNFKTFEGALAFMEIIQ